MSVWFAKVALLLGIAAMIAIRPPHGHRSATIKVVESGARQARVGAANAHVARKPDLSSNLDRHTAVVVRRLSAPPSAPFFLGVVLYSLGLWLFHRSHVDLATNWSVSLDIRENHTLVTSGVYRTIRHPMYAAIFLQAIGQASLVPNWITGPFEFFAFVLMFALRIGPEERMMLEHFGRPAAGCAGRRRSSRASCRSARSTRRGGRPPGNRSGRPRASAVDGLALDQPQHAGRSRAATPARVCCAADTVEGAPTSIRRRIGSSRNSAASRTRSR